MTFGELVEPLLARRDLDEERALALMDFLMSGEATEAQVGGVLLALRVKGTTTRELAAFARILRQRALTLHHSFETLVDTCGTGGGIPTFNISTASAIVAAAAGAKVAKHGNRAVTSRCGSADVLEALGVPIQGDAEVLLHRLEQDGLVFLFAPAHHPAMRHVGKARKDLGVRTVFNQLGPLANPAGAKRQLIGVYDDGLMRSMGEALNCLGTERALLVHGDDGMDEVSPVTSTQAIRVWEGRVESITLYPKDFGLDPIDPVALLPGDDAQANAEILREAIGDPDSPRAAAILPSCGATLWLAGVANSLPEATELARATIASGAALRKLEDVAGGTDSA
jgi:anthranilate phosphoribosyltransferase